MVGRVRLEVSAQDNWRGQFVIDAADGVQSSFL
jgi:hypothetical protein